MASQSALSRKIRKLKELKDSTELFDSSGLFDVKTILQNTPDKDKLSVIIKKDKIKGTCLFATKPIKEGDTIAYYKLMVFTQSSSKPDLSGYDLNGLKKICDKLDISIPQNLSVSLSKLIYENIPTTLIYKNKKWRVPYGKMYNFTVYNKNGRPYTSLIGDLYKGSIPSPVNNIPYWAYFSNEPSPSQKSNSQIFLSNILDDNYKNRTFLKEGDTLVYRLVATTDIKKGEEITWCYGDDYGRNYDTSC